LIYGTGWTTERVKEQIIAGLKDARARSVLDREALKTLPNGIGESRFGVLFLDTDGRIRTEIRGMDLFFAGQHCLEKGTRVRKHFDQHCRCILDGLKIGDVLLDLGWPRATHDRQWNKACGMIATFVNQRRVVDGGKSSRFTAPHGRADPSLVCLPGKKASGL
jgi:hypothetical protein